MIHLWSYCINGNPETGKGPSNLNSFPASLPSTYFLKISYSRLGGISLLCSRLPVPCFISASLSGYTATELMVPKRNNDVKPPGKEVMTFLKITNYERGGSYMPSSNPPTSLTRYHYPVFQKRKHSLPEDYSNQPHQFTWDWGASRDLGLPVLKLQRSWAKLVSLLRTQPIVTLSQVQMWTRKAHTLSPRTPASSKLNSLSNLRGPIIFSQVPGPNLILMKKIQPLSFYLFLCNGYKSFLTH